MVKMNGIARLRTCLSMIIIAICYSITSWQAMQCIVKYLDEPQGTKLSIENARLHPYPAITICPLEPSKTYNENILKDCKIDLNGGWEKYVDHGIWVGKGNKSCTDPKYLHASLMTNPEDIIYGIQYIDFEENESIFYKYENGENGIWSHIDTRKFGRCFNAEPNKVISKRGIEKIILIMKEESKVYFHTPGMLFTDQELTSISIFFRKKMKVTLEYELYKVLDMDGDPCNHAKNYAKDTCVIEEADDKSMKMFGCTTPFGFDKDMICQDEENATEVLDLYIKAFEGKQEHECMHPCNFIKPRAIITEEKNMPLVGFGSFTHKRPHMEINLKSNIRVTQAHYLYSGLSMVAEIGGYVGLFLGVSFNKLAILTNTLITRLDTLSNTN